MIEPSATLAAMPAQGGIEAVYAGVDWLSCSCAAERNGRWAWTDDCRRIIEEIAQEGNKLEACNWNGYRGLRAGGSFFGSRDDGSYLQLSGHYADHLYLRVYRDDLHISRIDVQATVRYLTADNEVGRRAYDAAVDANGTLVPSRRRRIWFMSASDGGYTAYIGAPTSEQRAKIYNKAIQTERPEYERCWRWEVTYKNDYATQYAALIADRGDERATYCAGVVAGWFIARGVPLKWWNAALSVAMPLIKEVPSDAEKRLKWLREQVRPAINWLVANGFEPDVREAIGFT